MGFLQTVIAEARSTVSGPAASNHLPSMADFGSAVLKPSLSDAVHGREAVQQESIPPQKNVDGAGAADRAIQASKSALSPVPENQAGQITPQDERLFEKGENNSDDGASNEKVFSVGELHAGTENSVENPLEPLSPVAERRAPDQTVHANEQHLATESEQATPPKDVASYEADGNVQSEAATDAVPPPPESQGVAEHFQLPETAETPQELETRPAEPAPLKQELGAPVVTEKDDVPELLKTVLEPKDENGLDTVTAKLKRTNDPPSFRSADDEKKLTSSVSTDRPVHQLMEEESEPIAKALSRGSDNEDAGRSGQRQQRLKGGIEQSIRSKQHSEVMEKTVSRQVKGQPREMKGEESPVLNPQPEYEKAPDHATSPANQQARTVVHKLVPDLGSNKKNVARLPETRLRQPVYQNETRSYPLTMNAPQPVRREPEVKIGQVDVFIEGPQKSSGPPASSPRPTLSLASRHYLRRI